MRYNLVLLIVLSLLACGANEPETIYEHIPGIHAEAIYKELAGKGFLINGTIKDGYQNWDCTYRKDKSKYSVMIGGKANDRLTVILAHVTYATEGMHEQEFIGDIAAISYDGSKPRAARDWVNRQPIGKSDTLIGPVRFFYFAEANIKTLKMVPKDAEKF